MTYLWVAIGGALGTLARFWVSDFFAKLTGPGFPWGTILINIAGSCLIGWFAGLTVYGKLSQGGDLRAFLMAGICGGFTTFSAFSLQTIELLRQGRPGAAAANVALSVLLCGVGTALGLQLGRLG